MPYAGLRMTVAQKAEAIATLRERYVAAGRDPRTLEVCDALGEVEGSIGRTLDQVPALAEAGVTVVRVHLRRLARSPDEVLPTLEEVVRRFEPLRALHV
jgi:hypothetical protein